MYIFRRSTIAALGRQFDAMPAAVGVADMVAKLTGKELNVFTARFGRGHDQRLACRPLAGRREPGSRGCVRSLR